MSESYIMGRDRDGTPFVPGCQATREPSDQELLNIVEARMAKLQSGNAANPYTADALTHVRMALVTLNKRSQQKQVSD